MTHQTELVKQWAKATHAVSAPDIYQTYKVNHHIDSIGNILLKVLSPLDSISQQTLEAAYLHDIVEDTPIPLAAIESMFGTRVAELVGLLTEDSSKTRRERQADAYSKINKDHDATLIKLADRISNIEYTLWGLQNTHYDHLGGRIDRSPTPEESTTALKKAKMYLKEYKLFREMLYKEKRSEVAEKLWVQLDAEMAFLKDVMSNK